MPYRVAVEEAKVHLTGLKIELNDAELITFGKMLHYINEKMNSENKSRIMSPNIELIHIFVLNEFIIKDQIAMAKSHIDTVTAELKLRNDRVAFLGADVYAEDNVAILNAQDGYAIAEMSFNLHTKNHNKHIKHYAYFHAGRMGSVSLLTLGYAVLFFTSWYAIDRCFKHEKDCSHEGGEADDMYK